MGSLNFEQLLAGYSPHGNTLFCVLQRVRCDGVFCPLHIVYAHIAPLRGIGNISVSARTCPQLFLRVVFHWEKFEAT
jgi:hypothetical protein